MVNINNTSNLIAKALMDYLRGSGKLKLLPEVTEVLEGKLDKSKTAQKIIVESVVSLDDEQARKIKKLVKNFLNQDLPVINKINKKLIGGFTIKAGEWFLDASILHDLDNLKFILHS